MLLSFSQNLRGYRLLDEHQEDAFNEPRQVLSSVSSHVSKSRMK
jgi:hypothetical protein